MNLAEALNAALPDLPVRRSRVGYPKLDPATIHHENIEDGEPVIVIIVRGRELIYRLPPEQWHLVELFDGNRSWEEVADLYAELYGVRYDPEDVREFTSTLDAVNFWYQTPLERNVALQQKLEAGRHQHAHKKSKFGDVAHMQFSAWDPNRYFDRIYPWLRWIYTPWFAGLCLALFAFMTFVFIVNWGQIGGDTLQFYSFTQKTPADLAEFWILFLILGYFHESAHGLTCKHYGGQVHAMGFHLIYLTPAFFVDVSEAWVWATRWQRFITILAGIWVEMIFCGVATIVWWGTPAGSPAHDLAYKIMLITGVVVVVVNMNPLIKLDGYYAFSEILGFADIKEKSTSYLSGLVRRKIFRLPVEVDYVPTRRRAGFIFYAVCSGLYSYILLFTVIRFCDNVFSKYSPQWGFVPALALALVIFRSRLKTLGRFIRTVALDKRDRIRSWFTPARTASVLGALLLVLFLPIWHQTVTARFLLEPVRFAVVRSTVPGRVTAVLVHEGESVHAGDTLLRMASAPVDAARAGSGEDAALTGLERVQAQLTYADIGSALQQNIRARTQQAVVLDQAAQLTPRSPIDGVVAAPRLHDLVGAWLPAGATITQIDDLHRMRARIFVPDFAIGHVRAGAPVSLLVDGSFHPRSATVADLQPVAGDLPPAVESIKEIKGGARLDYYAVEAVIANDGSLHAGVTGTARIAVRRTSLAGSVAREVRDFVQRKLW
jgi:putative peptide zinc metalloprotease protein